MVTEPVSPNTLTDIQEQAILEQEAERNRKEELEKQLEELGVDQQETSPQLPPDPLSMLTVLAGGAMGDFIDKPHDIPLPILEDDKEYQKLYKKAYAEEQKTMQQNLQQASAERERALQALQEWDENAKKADAFAKNSPYPVENPYRRTDDNGNVVNTEGRRVLEQQFIDADRNYTSAHAEVMYGALSPDGKSLEERAREKTREALKQTRKGRMALRAYKKAETQVYNNPQNDPYLRMHLDRLNSHTQARYNAYFNQQRAFLYQQLSHLPPYERDRLFQQLYQGNFDRMSFKQKVTFLNGLRRQHGLEEVNYTQELRGIRQSTREIESRKFQRSFEKKDRRYRAWYERNITRPYDSRGSFSFRAYEGLREGRLTKFSPRRYFMGGRGVRGLSLRNGASNIFRALGGIRKWGLGAQLALGIGASLTGVFLGSLGLGFFGAGGSYNAANPQSSNAVQNAPDILIDKSKAVTTLASVGLPPPADTLEGVQAQLRGYGFLIKNLTLEKAQRAYRVVALLFLSKQIKDGYHINLENPSTYITIASLPFVNTCASDSAFQKGSILNLCFSGTDCVTMNGTCSEEYINRFNIAHELGHVLNWRSPQLYNDFYNTVYKTTPILPTYNCDLSSARYKGQDNPWRPNECFADMIGEYLTYNVWRYFPWDPIYSTPTHPRNQSAFPEFLYSSSSNPPGWSNYYQYAHDHIFDGIDYLYEK